MQIVLHLLALILAVLPMQVLGLSERHLPFRFVYVILLR